MLKKIFSTLHLNTKPKCNKNSGLPKGAKKVVDLDSLDETLLLVQIKLMNHQKDSGKQLVIDLEEKVPGLYISRSSSEDPLFDYEEHPMVEGCRWQHGYSIEAQDGTVFIFLHRMGITRPDDEKVPLVYTYGNVSEEEVLHLTGIFFSFLKKKICHELNRIARQDLAHM